MLSCKNAMEWRLEPESREWRGVAVSPSIPLATSKSSQAVFCAFVPRRFHSPSQEERPSLVWSDDRTRYKSESERGRDLGETTRELASERAGWRERHRRQCHTHTHIRHPQETGTSQRATAFWPIYLQKQEVLLRSSSLILYFASKVPDLNGPPSSHPSPSPRYGFLFLRKRVAGANVCVQLCVQ